eukprot:scaffold22680_cov107-Cylindrotheca_fusiformis.AAC.13
MPAPFDKSKCSPSLIPASFVPVPRGRQSVSFVYCLMPIVVANHGVAARSLRRGVRRTDGPKLPQPDLHPTTVPTRQLPAPIMFSNHLTTTVVSCPWSPLH